MSDELAPDFRILPQAYAKWEEQDAPRTLEEVVLATFALPPEERPSLPIGAGLHSIPLARVDGRPFVVTGARRRDGRWMTIRMVRQLRDEE